MKHTRFAVLLLIAALWPWSNVTAQSQCVGTGVNPIGFRIAPARQGELDGIEALGTWKGRRMALNAGANTSEYATLYRTFGEAELGRPRMPGFTRFSVLRHIVPEQIHFAGKIGVDRFDPGSSFHFVDARNCAYSAGTEHSIRLALGSDTYFATEGVSGDRDKLMVGLSCLIDKMDDNFHRGGCADFKPNTWFVEAYKSRNLGDVWKPWGFLQLSGYFEDPIWWSEDDRDQQFNHFAGNDKVVLTLDGTLLFQPVHIGKGSLRFTPQIGGGLGFFSQDGAKYWARHADLRLNAAPILKTTDVPTAAALAYGQGYKERVQKTVLAFNVGVQYTHCSPADDGRPGMFFSATSTTMPCGQTFASRTAGQRDGLDHIWKGLVYLTLYTR